MCALKQPVCEFIFKNNTDHIIQFLANCSPNPHKKKNFYIDLSLIHQTYPKIIQEFLKPIQINNYSVPLIGSYKHWFCILKQDLENLELKEFIYHMIITQLEADIHNSKNNLQISNLVWYMPKERNNVPKHLTIEKAKSKNATNLTFVDNICAKLFLNEKKFSARKKYRKLLNQLNADLEKNIIMLKQNEKIEIEKQNDSNSKKQIRFDLIKEILKKIV